MHVGLAPGAGVGRLSIDSLPSSFELGEAARRHEPEQNTEPDVLLPQ